MSTPEPASYDPSLLTVRDRLRLQLGDTNVVKAWLPDVTYDAMLAHENTDERKAAIALADALYAKFAQEPSRVDITNVESAEWKNRLDAWIALARRLRAEIASEVSTAVRDGFRVMRPTRAGDARGGGEYYAGLRWPIDEEY